MSTNDRGQVHHSHARLAGTLSRLTDDDVRRPSLLPGWTVGHVVTHLARNADSFVRLLEGAARGEVAAQYPGGSTQRDGDIDAGSRRPAAQLVEDVVEASARLEAVWSSIDEEVWRTATGRFASGTWPLADLPFRRWREVEIHHVDLDLGYRWDDWPDGYVDAELERALAGLPGRLDTGLAVAIEVTDTEERWTVPEGSAHATPLRADRRLLLAWLVGRTGDGEGFPRLGPWAG